MCESNNSASARYREDEINGIKCEIFEKEFITSFDISIQLGIISDADVNVLLNDYMFGFMLWSTIAESRNVYLIQETLKLLKAKPNLEPSIRELALIAIRSNNELFLLEFLNDYELTEDFLKEVISAIFTFGSSKVFQELLSNAVTLPILENNPQLLILPENYFETYSDSDEFFRAYLSSTFSQQNQGQNDFILRAALNQSNNSFFMELISNENYRIDPEYLSKIIDNLNINLGETNFKYELISLFWNSERIYNLFSQLQSEERQVIFDKIFNEKSSYYYHLFSLVKCEFPYFDDFLSRQDLVKHTADLLLEDSFNGYKQSFSDNEVFLSQLTSLETFTSNPQLHHQFLLSTLKHNKYDMFETIARSKSIYLSFENFKEITRKIKGLNS